MMNSNPAIIVLCGAVSPEREVSLRSGAACADALRSIHESVELHILDENVLPGFLDPKRHVVFPVIHGDYGEDGGIQADLERGNFAYAGCDSASSRLCIDKILTKQLFRAKGIPVLQDVFFQGGRKPTAIDLISALGTDDVVIKPADKGSSVGLHLVNGAEAMMSALAEVGPGNWMAEPRVQGREMTIGVLDGEPLGIVEIVPKVGTYDYANKYTAGATEYRFPASVPQDAAGQISRYAREAFFACGCRDYARLDFIYPDDGQFVFLEINTMPGMTATSLLPKSASCKGLDFSALVRQMISPALQRFSSRR
ncbi:MAG: D-alanine--D-alanine ligase [Puniceicoccales bacterium]|jgi:D-alanine-D-alanine ligase|nr:D-alanine--D-alanine ligase [Puniceicoccales bacterium]